MDSVRLKKRSTVPDLSASASSVEVYVDDDGVLQLVNEGGTVAPVGGVLSDNVIFSQTLTDAAATIDTGAAAIPAGSMIRIIALTRTDNTTGTLFWRFNDSSSAVYDNAYAGEIDAGPGTGDVLGATQYSIAGAGSSSSTGVFSFIDSSWMLYAGSQNPKVGHITANIPNQSDVGTTMFEYACGFRSASPITRVSITAQAGSFVAGSMLVVLAVY